MASEEGQSIIYERALSATPGSYKIWHAYLRERLEIVRSLPITHSEYEALNNAFERALGTMHKMPRIWIMYLEWLTQQKLVGRTRRTFDRALRALPVTQHDRIWERYLAFVSQKGIPVETSLRVHRRYLKFDPSHMEDFIQFLVDSELWSESAERLAGLLNDEEDRFCSVKGKTKHGLWLELCDLLTQHAEEMSGGLNVDAIIRSGIRKFSDEVGRLWTSLANYYIRRGLMEKARDIFEEGMSKVITARDFSVIFDAYSQFEESMLSIKMEAALGDSEDEDGLKIENFWLKDDDDVDLRLARLENLMDRRPELVNSVRLRRNPHNVELWHRRVKLFDRNPTKQVLAYAEAVSTVDPMKAVGKPHTLWVAMAKLYESHKDVPNARVILDRAVQVSFKDVDHLASVWCEWAEMEIRHKNFEVALELIRRATAEPSAEVKARGEHVQLKLHKSVRLWSCYVDLEESLGSLDSTRKVYERILDLKIATPQIIINYASLLEDNKYFEDAFKVYERGVRIFKYPHAEGIWVTYLSKFVKRYAKSNLERVRELFNDAIKQAPAESVKAIYLQYAKLEEDFGTAATAMSVYDQATKAVPDNEKLGMYDIYIARAAEKKIGAKKTREIYQEAIQYGQLPDKDVKHMCIKFAELEKSLGETGRSRAIYKYASQCADPRSDPGFWKKWPEFEVQHGNEDTFREMLREKRSVTASYSQTHFILPEYLMQKDQLQTLEEAKDVLKMAGVDEDDMKALEMQILPSANDTSANDGTRKLGFVSAGVQTGGESTASKEDIELPEDRHSEDGGDETVEIAQKDVPSAVFGGSALKRAGMEGVDSAVTDDSAEKLGALERIKRMRRGE